MTDLLHAHAEQLSFNSASWPEHERFDRYRELYASTNAQLLGDQFGAHVRGFRLDRAILYDRRLNDVEHRRDLAQVARDAFDHWTLTHVCAGEFEVDSGWGFVPVLPGETILLDMTRPAANRARDARIITVSIARERVSAVADDLDALQGLVLSATRAGLLGDYMISLADRLPDVAAAAVPAAARPLAILLAVALASDAEALAPPTPAERVRRLIEAELGDPQFGPARLVALSGLSRATLYRLFQSQGGLAAFLQRRRLSRVRLALADVTDRRSFAEIAHAAGFASEGHCSRLFRSAFGKRPGEYRATIATGTEAVPAGRMRFWQDEVR